MLPRQAILIFLAALASNVPARGSSQPKIKNTPTVATAEKVKVFEILVRVETDKRLESLAILPTAPENFCIRAAAMPGLSGYRANTDGSAFLQALTAGSAVTFQFRVAAPTELQRSRGSCWTLERTAADSVRDRTRDNTRDNRQFVFNAQYRTVGAGTDTASSLWSETVEVKYTTSQMIFLGAGMIGVLLGYIVKSLTARKKEADTAKDVSNTRHGQLGRLLEYVFLTSIDKLLTSLVLGFGALLALAKAGIPVGGAGAALAIGISLGVLADDALISKVK